jgi:3-oxoadipate enol-lactonase
MTMDLPPLILVHGYPFDHTLWDSVARTLGNRTKVFAPDLPGFGGRSTPVADPSIDIMADEIAELCESEHFDRVVVVGMSMGGYVALSLAERYPDKLAGLGLVSTQAGADTEETRKSRQEMIRKVRAEGPQSAAIAAIPKLFAPGHINNEALKKIPTEGARRAGVEGICWALEAMARRPDRRGILKSIQVPVLVLHGSEDQFIPRERARQMADEIPDGEYMEIAGSGHALPVEAPEAVVQSLRRLLERAASFSPEPGAGKPTNRPAWIISPTEHGL